jgi:two-component system chemotaxis sensor kinase CheA
MAARTVNPGKSNSNTESKTVRSNQTHKQAPEIVAPPQTESASLPEMPAPPPPRIDSLDDIVAFLMMIEPADRLELSAMRNALTEFAERETSGSESHSILICIRKIIDDVISGESEDPVAALSEAGKLAGNAVQIRASAPIRSSRKPEKESSPEEASHPCSPNPDHELDFKEVPEPEVIPATTVNVVENPMPAPMKTGTPVTAQPPLARAAAVPVIDPMPEDADLDLMREFVTESFDYIEGAEAALLSLEADPENQEAVNSVFRAFHTIKGTSGFMGLTRVSELAHRAESLLSRVRDKEIQCTGVYADLTLRSIDVLKELMKSVRGAIAGNPMTRPAGFDVLLADLSNPEAPHLKSSFTPAVAEPKATAETVQAASSEAPPAQKAADAPPAGKAEAAPIEAAKPARNQQRSATSDNGSDSSLRVRTDRLDRLIDLVGELVIAQSMVAQDGTIHQIGNHELLKKVTHSGKIVRELQDLTVSMRMVPLKNAFQKMARLARDLGHKNGKLVNFLAEGEETEIDRNMVDVISDPLVHMVRNAIDHGIESPEVREASSKAAAGTLRISAYHSGGDVVVELQDDGKGLDRAKILDKARAKGLIDPDRILSDREIFDLIFAPGFSTADKITDISGRGVGMDVVKRSVEALRGRIEIVSAPGKGTTFTIRLPLTLAITDGMLVKVGNERYIIPTVNIHLSFRPDSAALWSVAGKGEMVMLRGELMPLFRLYRLFGVVGALEDPTRALLVVVADGTRRCALLVDELLGQQQVVAKSLGNGVGKVQGVSGGAILGDGRVGLILDPSEIVALARYASDHPAPKESAA